MIAILVTILYFSSQDKPYYVCAIMVLGKLYSNSLLLLFNNRIRIIGGRGSTRSGSGSNLHISFSGATQRLSSEIIPTQPNVCRRIAADQPGAAVYVREEVYVHTNAFEMDERVSRLSPSVCVWVCVWVCEADAMRCRTPISARKP